MSCLAKSISMSTPWRSLNLFLRAESAIERLAVCRDADGENLVIARQLRFDDEAGAPPVRLRSLRRGVFDRHEFFRSYGGRRVPRPPLDSAATSSPAPPTLAATGALTAVSALGFEPLDRKPIPRTACFTRHARAASSESVGHPCLIFFERRLVWQPQSQAISTALTGG